MPQPTSNQLDWTRYFQLQKYDEFQGIASGIATAEKKDYDGETLLYNESKPYFQTWSDNCLKDSRGLNWGNIRLQHSDKDPVGKLNSPIVFDDAKKEIRVEAKIVDPVAKDLLREGVLTGFSIGGRYVKRNADGSYVADPIEISVVDRPCLPEATFQTVKSDGSCELRKFASKETAESLMSKLKKTDNVDNANEGGGTNCREDNGLDQQAGEKPGCAPATTPSDGTKDIEVVDGNTNTEITDKAAKCACKCVACKANNCPGCTENCDASTNLRAEMTKAVRYLVTEDDGTTHLPVTNADGSPNHNLMGAAWAALHSGYRGNKYEGPDKQKAIDKLTAMYHSEGMDLPDSANKAETNPDYSTLLKKLDELSAQVAEFQKAKDSKTMTPEQIEKARTAVTGIIGKAQAACAKAHEDHVAMCKSHHEERVAVSKAHHDDRVAMSKAKHDEMQGHLANCMKAITGEEPADVAPQTTKTDKVEDVKKEDVTKEAPMTQADLEAAVERILGKMLGIEPEKKEEPVVKAEQTLDEKIEAALKKFVGDQESTVRKQNKPILNTDNVKKSEVRDVKELAKGVVAGDNESIAKMFSAANLKKA